MVSDSPDWTNNINIVGSTVTLNIAIQSSAVTLNVNIASSAITLNVNIASAAATVNVNIAGQTGNVNVNLNAATVTLNINFLGQFDAVRGLGDYHATQGAAVTAVANLIIPQGVSTTVLTYLNGSGLSLWINGVSWAGTDGGVGIYCIAVLSINGTVIVTAGSVVGDSIIFATPQQVGNGSTFRINIIIASTVAGNINCFATFWGVNR